MSQMFPPPPGPVDHLETAIAAPRDVVLDHGRDPDPHDLHRPDGSRGDRRSVPARDAGCRGPRQGFGVVPPRGFDPLISTLKGWRPRPLDDGGEGRPSVAKGPRGAAQPEAGRPSRNRSPAGAKQPAAASAESPPTIACPNARASRPRTLERQVARAPTMAIAPNTSPRTTAPDASSGIWLVSRTVSV